KADIEIEIGYAPTVNTDEAVDIAAEAARKIVGEGKVDLDVDPTRGAGDIGAYQQKKPGDWIVVGQATEDPDSRHNQGLHTPRYDFNDDILPIGISWFVSLVENHMPLEK